MLRPEQMSKVSVTGSKRVMGDVIETVHDLRLLHVSDYDESWAGFSAGDPIEGAEEASDKLVTVRSLESILDVDDEDAGPTRIVTDEAIEEELEGLRHRVNELDDRRDEIRDQLRDVEERLDVMEPFATLGIDLDLLSGYRTLDVAVGEGSRDSVEAALESSEDVEQYRVDSSGKVVAVFARMRDGADEGALADALVAADFAAIDVPDAEGSPEEYRKELEHQRQQLRSKLDNVEGELKEVKLDAAGFLLAAEEKLSIDVQKTEAPLSFATTENAFVAEGWVPTERFDEFEAALREDVGQHVDVEELRRASFGRTGTHEETVRDRPEGAAAATDGGHAVDGDEPPVIQDNPSAVKPFELLVQAVNRPNYREFDPTIFLFLTFPLFFGFMIGDLGYGLLYTALGAFMYTSFDSEAIKSLGGVAVFAGVFTMIFGVLYGEFFGLHVLGEIVWPSGHPPMEKGLSPATTEWALGWLLVSVLVGIAHLTLGWGLDFIENLQFHGLWDAITESLSWIIAMLGLWYWIFSESLAEQKPAFLFEVFNGEPFPFGFEGFPAFELFALPQGLPVVGGFPITVSLLLVFVGAGLLYMASPVEVVEILNVLVNALSYTRLAAVLLAKAGMAFTVNLLFFGVYVSEEEGGEAWHFGLTGMPEAPPAGETVMYHGYEVSGVLFPGLVHGGVAMLLVGILVLVLGHLLVLVLGITSAGLQAVRLEYVEFFGKFFEGGGRPYSPFGYDRQYTTED
ncbi:V-type ATP synthase subunit I [Halobium salinum]|uniref:A-type ATP synthase subunit I n=1 Tax=Halobium salinum TaxID=1364940 RepID=A0ABD5PFR7_9EURY|nr:V-type ATPase 116kDa subunit family protein [Halobium salinum]